MSARVIAEYRREGEARFKTVLGAAGESFKEIDAAIRVFFGDVAEIHEREGTEAIAAAPDEDDRHCAYCGIEIPTKLTGAFCSDACNHASHRTRGRFASSSTEPSVGSREIA